MALSDGIASVSQVEAATERARERARLAEQAAALEAARASEEHTYTDPAKNIWHYVILDGSQVRIESLEPAIADIVIPPSIEDLPVRALAQDALAHHDDIASVVCPDEMISIGFCAFRNDANLQRVHLPRSVTDFDSDWFRRCVSLESLDLPGGLEKIDPYLFDIPNLKVVRIGHATSDIEPGAFAKSKLECIELAEDNQFLSTDGHGLYSKGSEVFIALGTPLSSYEVQEGVRVLAKKAFSTFRMLADVSIPDSVEVISDYAYSKTGITEFSAPRGLRSIMDRAFFDCTHLESVSLGEPLTWVGDNAFSNTALARLALPASIEHIGHPLAAHTKIVFSGPDATLHIEGGSRLMLDGHGGLYEKLPEGAYRLILLVDPRIKQYTVLPGTKEIAAHACAGHERLEQVSICEGVTAIGEGAFKNCRALRAANLPDSLRFLGKEAFLGCNLEELTLPVGLEQVGEMALVMYGAHHGSTAPSLKDLKVDPRNDRFFMAESLLMERTSDGFKVIHYTDTEPCVVVPEGTKAIAPYAFNGARNLHELTLSTEIANIGMRGLAVDCHIDLVQINLASPIEGHERFAFAFPATDRGTHHLQLALGVPQYLDLEGLFAAYDNAIVHARNFDSSDDVAISLYDQASKVIERLEDPVFMSKVNKEMLTRFMRNHLADVAVAISKRADKASIEKLVDLGFIDAENITQVVESVGVLQDAAMTSYLLTIKRDRFGKKALDFSL